MTDNLPQKRRMEPGRRGNKKHSFRYGGIRLTLSGGEEEPLGERENRKRKRLRGQESGTFKPLFLEMRISDFFKLFILFIHL